MFVNSAEASAVTEINTPAQVLGRQLKLERVAAGAKLIHIAAAVGVSAGHLSHIEAGNRKADAAMVQRIREAIQAAA